MRKPSELENIILKVENHILIQIAKTIKTQIISIDEIKCINQVKLWCHTHIPAVHIFLFFFFHQTHKFGPLNNLRSTNIRHIEIGPNFMLLGPHLYKILPWAASTSSLLVLALGYKSSILKKFNFIFKSSISL